VVFLNTQIPTIPLGIQLVNESETDTDVQMISIPFSTPSPNGAKHPVNAYEAMRVLSTICSLIVNVSILEKEEQLDWPGSELSVPPPTQEHVHIFQVGRVINAALMRSDITSELHTTSVQVIRTS